MPQEKSAEAGTGTGKGRRVSDEATVASKGRSLAETVTRVGFMCSEIQGRHDICVSLHDGLYLGMRCECFCHKGATETETNEVPG